MPTPKQVRYHYRKIMRLVDALSAAMTNAHDAGVLKYEMTNYTNESPCATHYQTEQRVWDTTKEQLAEAMRREIMTPPPPKKKPADVV